MMAQKVQTLEDVESKQLPYVPPPPRAHNGGLYTGEPFQKDAPWANVPVIPDVDYMTHVNLRSANPPPQALYQYQGNTRPGNNYQANTGLTPYVDSERFDGKPYNFSCVSCTNIKPIMNECRCKQMSAISGNEFGACTCKDVAYMQI
jgi:hypothetical protein